METTALGGDEFEFRQYIDVIRHRKWSVFFVTFFVVAAAILYSVLQEPMYRATTKLLLEGNLTEQILSPTPDQKTASADAAKNVETEIEVMKSRSVQDAVKKALGTTSAIAAPKVDIAQVGSTNVVTLTATSSKKEEAARIANTYAKTYVDTRRAQHVQNLTDAAAQIQPQIDDINKQMASLEQPLRDLDAQIVNAVDSETRARLQTQRNDQATLVQTQRNALQSRLTAYQQQLDELKIAGNVSTTGGAQVVSEAIVPTHPFAPQPIRNAIAAVIVGLALGVVLAFVREYYDDNVRTKEDLERATRGRPVLGLIPRVRQWREGQAPLVIVKERPQSAPAEAYRTLRTSLQFVGIEHDIGVVQVTSPRAADGKTSTVANLAVSLARAGRRTVIVDCDLRRPRVHEFFGLRNDIGLTSALIREVSVATAVQPVAGEPGLAVIAAGPPPPNPSELLSSHRYAEVLQKLRAEADFILIDSPPVLPVTDPLVLSATANAVILVVGVLSSRRDTVRAVELLDQVNAPLAGSVLNRVDEDELYGYGRYADYHYVYGSNGDGKTDGNGSRRSRRRAKKLAAAQSDNAPEVREPEPKNA